MIERDDKNPTREHWIQELTNRATRYWTERRIHGQMGKRRILLHPIKAAPLLRVIGLLRADASMPPDLVHKYMQINHMVALLEPLLRDLSQQLPLVRILDAGCGSSYLTMLLAWCYRHQWQRPVQILGIDRNPAIIETCQERAAMIQLDELVRFKTTSINDVDLPALWTSEFGKTKGALQVHVLVALHACDTATDDALGLGLKLKAELIATAPCCHAELARQWSHLAENEERGVFAPVWNAPHLRREAGATMTDTLRTLLLRGCGYTVTPMEFVPSTHTPKNTLLRALRCDKPDEKALEQYLALRAALGGVDIKLAQLLPPEHHQRLEELEKSISNPG